MPSYLKNKLPRFRRPLYRQSNSNTFHKLKCKSLRYTSSFFPVAITSWNNGITHFNDIPSVSVLKIHILSLIRPKKKMYFWYTWSFRTSVPLPTKSGLKFLRISQKMSFIDIPSDKCLCNQGIEDTNHFLFLCPFIATRRATLTITVIAILHKYGLTHLGNQSHH